MKKVLICMLQLHKNSGSARTAMENVDYCKARGYEVHVAAMTISKSLLKDTIVTYHKMLPWIKSTGKWRRFWYNYQVQRLRKKIKPDITIGHGDIFDQNIVTLHNCVHLASEKIHGKPLETKAEMNVVHSKILNEKKFNLLIANSHIMKNELIKRFSLPAEKIQVIYPAVNTDIFKPSKEEERVLLRKKFHFPDKIVVSLVTSGNLKKRGADILIKALDLLPERVKESIDVRVVGKVGPDFNHPSITFDAPMDAIQDYYKAIDVFVLPARIEEFGRVVAEAMSSGVPVITTNMVGASELMENLSQEFIINPEDAPALANSISKLVIDPVLRKQIGKLNRISALKNSEHLLNEKFDRAFESLNHF